MLTDRQKMILSLIVEEHVNTAEPVGSKTLSEYISFSPATLRNEMATLEELGYIEKTHTSSGRVPSEEGYRYYVETLLNHVSEGTTQYSLIDELFDKQDLKREETIESAVELLSQITNYTTIALGPNAYGSKVGKVELIPLNDQMCVILVVTNFGHVESRQVSLDDNANIDELKRVIEIFNDILKGCPISQVSEKLLYEVEKREIKELLKYRETIVDDFIKAFMKFTQSKYYMSGQTNILDQPEFRDIDKVRELLKVIEQKEIFKLVDSSSDGMTVKIGHENQVMAMKDCTLITVPYDISDSEHGTIAVVGPTRMEYKKVIPILKYIAKNMSKLYDK